MLYLYGFLILVVSEDGWVDNWLGRNNSCPKIHIDLKQNKKKLFLNLTNSEFFMELI